MGEVERLGTLAGRINAEHAACQMAALDALEHAMNAGDLLLQAKAVHKRGTWLAWLGDNFEGSVRTAQVYMRLSRDRILLEAAKTQSAAHLSISGALEALVAPPKGLPPIPSNTPPVHWPEAQDKPEEEERVSDAEYVLSTVAALLGEALAPALALRPGEAAEALARMKRKDRAALSAKLHDGVAWLERVLEEAERA